MITPESFARMCGSVRELAEAGGRDLPASYAFAAYVYVCLDDDPALARRRADEHLAWRYSEPRFTGELAGKYAVAGDAEDCAEGLQRFVDAGATHLVLSVVRREGEDPRSRRSRRLPRESCHTFGLVDRIRPMAAGTFRRYPFRSAFTSARNGNVSQSPVPRSACAAMRLPARAQSVTPKPSTRP